LRVFLMISLISGLIALHLHLARAGLLIRFSLALIFALFAMSVGGHRVLQLILQLFKDELLRDAIRGWYGETGEPWNYADKYGWQVEVWFCIS
jgi:hypothetical protein